MMDEREVSPYLKYSLAYYEKQDEANSSPSTTKTLSLENQSAKKKNLITLQNVDLEQIDS